MKVTFKVKYDFQNTIAFLNNLGLFLSARENVSNNFKRKIFQMKHQDKTVTPEPKPEPAREWTKAKTKSKIASRNFK